MGCILLYYDKSFIIKVKSNLIMNIAYLNYILFLTFLTIYMPLRKGITYIQWRKESDN